MHMVLLSKHSVQPVAKGTKEALREIIVQPFPAEEEFFRSSENFSLRDAEKLENLLTRFSCDVSAEEAWSEFAVLKLVLVSSDLYASFSYHQFAETALHEHHGVFTEMEKLIKIAMIIPFESVM